MDDAVGDNLEEAGAAQVVVGDLATLRENHTLLIRKE
jgi:hypothetical protein